MPGDRQRQVVVDKGVLSLDDDPPPAEVSTTDTGFPGFGQPPTGPIPRTESVEGWRHTERSRRSEREWL